MKKLILLAAFAATVAVAQVTPTPTPTAVPVAVQVVQPVATAPSVITQLFNSSALYEGLFTFAAGLYAWWKHSKLGISQKMLAAAVKGVEFATSLPEAQAVEAKVKDAIKSEAIALGVQDDLDKIVTNLTPQQAAATSVK